MDEIDLKDLFLLFWRKKIIILIVMVIFTIMGIIYSIYFVTPVYESSTSLVLAGVSKKTDDTTLTAEDAEITETDLTLNSKLINTYSELIKSNNILREVISNLNLDMDEEDLRGKITVSAIDETEIIRINVLLENKELAAEMANETAEVFTSKVAEIYNIQNIYVVDEAEVAKGPSNINYPRDIAIFVLIGITLSVAYVLITNMMDTTIKKTEDIEALCKYTVLASIPQYLEKLDKGGRR